MAKIPVPERENMQINNEVGQQPYRLCLAQDGHIYDVVVKDKIQITRSKNAPSKLTCSILRDQITAECGSILAFTFNRVHNQFYGYIVTTHKSGDWCEVEAYDQLYYMNRNKSRMSYENLTASEVAIRLCQDRQYNMLDPPWFTDTKYKIPSRVEENVSDLTIITTALDLTFQHTGFRYFVWDDYGNLTISHDGEMAADCNLLLTRGYMENYNLEETLEDCWTAARIEKQVNTGDNKIETTTAVNTGGVNRYGFLEYFGTAGENENPRTLADEVIKKQAPPTQKLSLTGVQGDITVRGGTPILVDFYTGEKAEYIRAWYACESVTHTIDNYYHTMDLELSLLVRLDKWDSNDPNYYSYPFGII